jgi:hypothetical protein
VLQSIIHESAINEQLVPSNPKEHDVPKFNPSHKAVLDSMLLANPLIRPGKMFGYPAYYVGSKLCICLYEEGIGIKLPQQTAAKLIETDPAAAPFTPMRRRKMREWVQITLTHSEDYRHYEAVFDEAIRHVLALQETPSK